MMYTDVVVVLKDSIKKMVLLSDLVENLKFKQSRKKLKKKLMLRDG